MHCPCNGCIRNIFHSSWIQRLNTVQWLKPKVIPTSIASIRLKSWAKYMDTDVTTQHESFTLASRSGPHYRCTKRISGNLLGTKKGPDTKPSFVCLQSRINVHYQSKGLQN